MHEHASSLEDGRSSAAPEAADDASRSDDESEQGTPQFKDAVDDSETTSAAEDSSPKVAVSSPTDKGTVKSLLQRFENGDSPSKAPVARPSLLVKETEHIPEGTDELLKEQESAASRAVLSAEEREPISSSVGAASMLEPDAVLENPFSSDSPSTPGAPKGPPLDERLSSISLGGTTTAGTPKPERGSKIKAASSENDPIEDALAEAQRAPLARESKRWSAASASAAGRAGRRSALIDNRGNGHRQSIDGLDKLRENFERERERQLLQSPRKSGEATLKEEDETGHQPEEEEDHIDWAFWGRVMSDYQNVARNSPDELSRAIQNGIPATLRGMMWQLMSSSKDEEMELIYAFYLKQTSPHEKAIRRDLARTFPEQDYFQEGAGTGQENLFNVVKAYSLYDEECGYCQGMQFIVGPLLLNMPDEEAFSTLVRLMKAYDLRGHFIPNMPSLQLRLYQFNRLLEDMLPLLHMHLTRIGVKGSMYASQWFMTLFSYRFPLDLVYRILDSVFAEGIEAIFRFALALMQKNEDALLKLNFEACLTFLKENLFDLYQSGERDPKGKPLYRTNDFVHDAFQVRIMPYNLDQYAAEFEEQVRAANAHRREVEALRLVNRNLAARVKELEENALAQSAEHVELVKQVVNATLAKDEMAEELVKYKMMYAEAVLAEDHARGSRASESRASESSTFDSTNLLAS